MPRIPEYRGKEELRPTGPVQLPLNLTTLPWQELERAGLQIAAIGQDLTEAHRAAVYSQNIADSASALQDLTLDFEQDPDIWTIEERAKKAVENFKQDRIKEIKDPIVAKNFGFAYDKLATVKMATIIRSARKRQADFNKAQTLSSLDALESVYHKSSTPAEAALILSQMKGVIMGQAKAGVLDYTEAQKEWKRRLSRMAGTDVREDIWENPREAHKNLIENQYEGLSDQDRIKYIEMAERRIEAEDRDAERLFRDAERQEAKELKERQEQNGILMLQMMADGTLTRKWIDQQIVRRGLDEGSVNAGLRWLEDGGGNVDDHSTINRLNDMILDEIDARAEINRAFANGQLRFDTYQTLKSDNQRRQDVQYRRKVKDAEIWLLNKLAIPTGELAPLKADESSRKADAQLQFKIKLDQNIEPMIAAREVLESIQPIISIPLIRLPVPPYGKNKIRNSQDLADATLWLWEQYRSGMPKNEAIYWHDILTNYQEIDMKFGIEELLKGIEEHEKTREKTIQKEFEERGMKRKTTRELK